MLVVIANKKNVTDGLIFIVLYTHALFIIWCKLDNWLY